MAQAQLTEEQKNAFSTFNSILDLYKTEFPETSIIAAIQCSDRLSNYMATSSASQAAYMALTNLLSTLSDLETSPNKALVTTILLVLNKIDVDDEGPALELLHDINQFLAGNEHAKQLLVNEEDTTK